MGRLDEAVEVTSLSEPFHVGEDGALHPKRIDLWQVREYILRRAGRSEQARVVLEGQLGALRRWAERPSANAWILYAYAWTLLVKCEHTDLHDPDTALLAARKAVEMTARQEASCLATLALAHKLTGDLDNALEVQREALSALPPGEWHARALYEIKLIAWMREKGESEKVAAMLQESYDRVRDAHDEEQARQVQRLIDLILDFRIYERGMPPPGPMDGIVGPAAQMAHGEHCAYDMLCNDIMQLRRGIKPQAQTGIATAAVELAEALIDKGEQAEADSLLRACLVIQEIGLPEGCWRIAETRSILGKALAAQKQFDEAESLLRDAYTVMENDPQAPHKRTNNALARIVNLYEAWNRPQQAAQWRTRPTVGQSSGEAIRPSP